MEDPEGTSSGRGYEFEHFVLEILKRSQEFEFPVSAAGPDGGFDVATKRNGREVLIEAKFNTPQTATRIRGAVAR